MHPQLRIVGKWERLVERRPGWLNATRCKEHPIEDDDEDENDYLHQSPLVQR